jgi:translation initiation factor 1 (eIF-1/SUI1)
MSKTTVAIKKITEDLDRISGCDGGIGDYIVALQRDIHNRVEWLIEWMTTKDDEE